MVGKEFEGRLGKMQDNWATSREEGFGGFPDGLFKFQLQNAEIVESMSSEKLQVHREHLCLEGEEAGNVLHDYLQLETEWGPRFTMQWIEQMGREIPDDMTDLEEVVAEIAEAAPIYMGRVKNKDGFSNLRITRLLQGEAEKEEVEAEEAEPEEDNHPECFGEYEEGHKTCKACEDKKTCKKKTVGDEDAGDEDAGDEEDAGDDDEGEGTLDELVAFCQAQEIDVDDDDTEESLTEKIKGFNWDRKELLEEEITMLENIDADFTEEKPKPKKKVVKKGGKKKKKK